MNKQGKKTPAAIEEFVVETKRNAPELTHPEIADRVAAKFGPGAQMDKTTVGNILRRHGISGRGRRIAASQAEDPAVASQRHWPELIDTAKTLQEQLDYGAPLPQILALPWDSPPEANRHLIIETNKGGQRTISLAVEKSPLFAALKQHLPSEAVWSKLEEWKLAVAELEAHVSQLCSSLQSEQLVQARQRVTRQEVDQGAIGVTDLFVKAAALEAAEKACDMLPNQHDYEVRPVSGHETWELRWARNGYLFPLLAAGHDQQELQFIQLAHRRLTEGATELAEMHGVVEAYQQEQQLRHEVIGELEQIIHRVTFPGRCSLYG